MIKRLLILTLSLGLTACGFTLRGDYLIPEQAKTLYLQSFDQHAEITKIVKRQLTIYDIKVLSDAQARTLVTTVPVIRILNDKLDRKTLSLFNTGQVAEHELIYTVNYQIIWPDSATQMAEPQDHELELLRNYQDDPNAVLAKSRELELLLSELRTQAADKIIRQLSEIQ